MVKHIAVGHLLVANEKALEVFVGVIDLVSVEVLRLMLGIRMILSYFNFVVEEYAF